MIATPEYNERRIMTYKEFVESDLCKKMVREEKDKEMLLQGEKNENVKKRWWLYPQVIPQQNNLFFCVVFYVFRIIHYIFYV